MTKPSIRLLMLRHQLERLSIPRSLPNSQGDKKLLTTTPEALLYAVKHELLPLGNSGRLSEFSDSILSAHASRFPLKLLQFSTAIKNNLTVVGVTTLLLTGFFFSHILSEQNTTTPVSQAQARLAPTTLAEDKSDPLRLSNAYKASLANGSGSQLYQSISPQSVNLVHIGAKTFDIGAKGDFRHLDYSVLPGQKGQSLFVSSNTSTKALLDSLQPGEKITITSEGKTYYVVFMNGITWQIGNDTILTNTQKSVITLFLPNDDTNYTTYQLRLTGLES